MFGSLEILTQRGSLPLIFSLGVGTSVMRSDVVECSTATVARN